MKIHHRPLTATESNARRNLSSRFWKYPSEAKTGNDTLNTLYELGLVERQMKDGAYTYRAINDNFRRNKMSG